MVVDATRWTIVDTATGTVPAGAQAVVVGGVSQHTATVAAASLAAMDGIADARVTAALRVVPHTAALQGV